MWPAARSFPLKRAIKKFIHHSSKKDKNTPKNILYDAFIYS
jgi:hypothetical protein